MNNQVFTNPNEITKGEFDELNRVNSFDMFTPQEITISALELAKLVKKGEVSELNEDELDIIKSGTEELKNLKRYTINEMIQGKIIRNDVYVQPKQVKWLDVIEKSDTGEKIEKGIYLDTTLNRELNRVGVTFEKGKKVMKSESDKKEDKTPEDEMVEKCMKSLRKADGDDEAVKEEMKKAFPEATEKEVEKAMKKAYKSVADDFMKKAEEDDETEEKSEKNEESDKKD
jgi:small-conductance mechanosensitive channel